MEKGKLRLHNRACRILGIGTDKLRLVSPIEFHQISGHTVSNYLGLSDKSDNIYYVRRGEPVRTYIHELLHLLFKHRPHWWIYCVAWKLTGQKIIPGWGKNYGYGEGLFVDSARMRELPSKIKLLKLIQWAYKAI